MIRVSSLPKVSLISAPRLSRSLKTTSYATAPPLSFSFDIDGVLIRGDSMIPSARKALKILDGDNPWNAKIPFILMTNGGGVEEKLRATMLSRELDFPIHEDRILQSHTVLKSLTVDAPEGESRADDHVLVVGGIGDSVRMVAESYGFKNVHTPLDILAWNPSIWPFHHLTDAERETVRTTTDFSSIPISSIFIFHDPRNWALDIQIICDVLRSHPLGLGQSYPARSLVTTPSSSPGDKDRKGVELYFCNPDLLWKARYHVPRFGQGAFKEAFQAVFRAATGETYPFMQFGKPHKLTYDYGKRMLERKRRELYPGAKGESTIFMVGDNPESDIAGANAANWKSFLVKTGVYDADSGKKPTHTPTELVEDVEAAVRRGIEMVLEAEAKR